MIEPQIADRMREDWNDRAREDAKYYVAFGRRSQNDEEFFDTGRDVVSSLEKELKRLPAANPRSRRALEIGCGPGRLMKPLSRFFGEIHGVDVSDEMVKLGRENLKGIPHAHVHHGTGFDLPMFADASFDFVYSYAVFQHIPSKEVVLEYINEIARVVKPGGIIRCQFNGLPQNGDRPDTWSGVRISAQDISGMAEKHQFQLLAMQGLSTQYLWVTMRKKAETSSDAVTGTPDIRIRRVTNTYSSEPIAPARGRFAAISLWVEGLPDEADLATLQVRIGTAKGFACYLGMREYDGMQQVNVILPPFLDTGLQPVQLVWRGEPVGAKKNLRILPPSPHIPRVLSVTDGINLLSANVIETRLVKVLCEEVSQPDQFEARVDGIPVSDLEIFCTDPMPSCFEFTFRLPEEIAVGAHQLEMKLGRRTFAPAAIQVQN